MEDLIDKIKRALNEFKELISHEPAIYKHRKISNAEEVIEILENIFDVNNEPDEHLINYFKFISKKKEYTVLEGQYLLFRSAIASLSKYTNPETSDIMAEHYHTAKKILNNNLVNEHFGKNEFINAFKKVKEDDYESTTIEKDKENHNKCKNILSKSSDKMILNALEYCNYSFDNIFEIFSFEIIQVMLEDGTI